jgi:hypothetical protein
MVVRSAPCLPFRLSCLEQSPLRNIIQDSMDVISSIFNFQPSSSYITELLSSEPIRLNHHSPMIAQFLVLGILSVSHSTSHPQCKLSDASHIRYIEYELPLLPSPPKFRVSAKSGPGIGNAGVLERSYFASKDHAQHGMDMYPDAEWSVERTGTQGVSSSAWLPMMNIPSLEYGSSKGGVVGSNVWTWRWAWVGSG